MANFDKEKELNEFMAIFKNPDKTGFTEQMRQMGQALDKVEKIYLQGYENGLEDGLRKIDIINDSN